MEAGDAIAAFLTGVSQEAFLASDLIRSAVMQKLMVIGEAAARVSEALRARHAEVRWADIVGFRNIAAHAYLTLDWPGAQLGLQAGAQPPGARLRPAVDGVRRMRRPEGDDIS